MIWHGKVWYAMTSRMFNWFIFICFSYNKVLYSRAFQNTKAIGMLITVWIIKKQIRLKLNKWYGDFGLYTWTYIKSGHVFFFRIVIWTYMDIHSAILDLFRDFHHRRMYENITKIHDYCRAGNNNQTF